MQSAILLEALVWILIHRFQVTFQGMQIVTLRGLFDMQPSEWAVLTIITTAFPSAPWNNRGIQDENVNLFVGFKFSRWKCQSSLTQLLVFPALPNVCSLSFANRWSLTNSKTMWWMRRISTTWKCQIYLNFSFKPKFYPGYLTTLFSFRRYTEPSTVVEDIHYCMSRK
jgi:hypothetical protein